MRCKRCDAVLGGTKGLICCRCRDYNRRMATRSWVEVRDEWEHRSGESISRQAVQEIGRKAVLKIRAAMLEDREICNHAESLGIDLEAYQ